MARDDKNDEVQQFVEEIDFSEIETEEVVGKGSFGVVWKGKWKGQRVAIKHINSEGERKAFTIEVRQLSRVAHPNIVKLYGACTKNPVCLVMEYAEGGSLYNVLHADLQPRYTAGHAISWALQCAQGVAYLHNMQPKPLIHRDLKPPNLLLILGGQTLKICDFGTACDLNTYMTNNKGSAAWMAPEVFEGSRYTEKCDVFSWGVILWEVLSRRKPFDDVGWSAYRIMWAVHMGQRPPLLENCPQPIEDLMIRCWSKKPEERPSMDEIVKIMSELLEFFSGHLQPIEYSITSNDQSERESDNNTLDFQSSLDSELYESNSSSTEIGTNNQSTSPNIKWPEIPQISINDSQAVKDYQNENNDANSNSIKNKALNENHWVFSNESDVSYEIQPTPGLDITVPKNKNANQNKNENFDNIYNLLDAELRPCTPDFDCPISCQIFEEHKKLAQEYLKVQTEIALLGQHKQELLANLNSENVCHVKTLNKLEDEKESLLKLYRNLKRQLELMAIQQNNMLENSASLPVVTGEDGWVKVPRQNSSRLS